PAPRPTPSSFAERPSWVAECPPSAWSVPSSVAPLPSSAPLVAPPASRPPAARPEEARARDARVARRRSASPAPRGSTRAQVQLRGSAADASTAAYRLAHPPVLGGPTRGART